MAVARMPRVHVTSDKSKVMAVARMPTEVGDFCR